MIVILIIAILVAIAIPTYMILTDKASRNVAESNRRIGTSALDSVYMSDIVGKGGGPAYVDPGTGAPIDAAYLRAREPKIKWVDFTYTAPGTPPFSGLSADMLKGVSVVRVSGAGDSVIVIATFSKDGDCFYEQYEDGQSTDSGVFHWDDGPPP